MANNLFKHIYSGCPICGKLFCKYYGYNKSDKTCLKKKTRNKIKIGVKNDLLY